MKFYSIVVILCGALLSGCGGQGKEGAMPSLSKLIELQNNIGVGVTRVYDKALVYDFEDASFKDWGTIIVLDEAAKASRQPDPYPCINDAPAGERLVLTIAEYAALVQKDPPTAPKPVLPGENYATVDQHIAQIQSELKQYSAVVYRYCAKYPVRPPKKTSAKK